MPETLNLLLTHQRPDAVARMLEFWRQAVPADSLAIAYGGTRENFDAIAHEAKVYIDSERLRTVDHQRERQSYITIFRAVRELPRFRDFSYVHLAEYDQIPLLQQVDELQRDWLLEQQADVLGYYLQRIDQTNSAHYLMHWSDAWFRDFLHGLSVRPDWKAVYALKGYGTYWRREAWEAVAGVREPGPVYLEQWMPTVAHHLGFRLRPIPHDPENRVPVPKAPREQRPEDKDPARTQWFLHPQTDLWMANGV